MPLLDLPHGLTWPDLSLINTSWLLFGTSETHGIPLGSGWINLSVPWTAPNYHLRNLELIVADGHRPQGVVWLMPDPNRVTVFDQDDGIAHWGVPDRSPWHTQGQTPRWDQHIRLRHWQQISDQLCANNHWWTWSRLTHQLMSWPLIRDPDQPDFADRLRLELTKLR